MNGKFTLDNSFGPVSSEELQQDLRYVASQLGGTPLTFRRYNERGKFAPSTVCIRFGSWNSALDAAGLNRSEVRNKLYSDEELFTNVMSLWEHYGRQPRSRELAQSPSVIRSVDTYVRRFGSWIEALRAFVAYANSEEIPAPKPKLPAGVATAARGPSLRMRFYILSRDKFSCVACGASPANEPGLKLHIDHKVPWSRGGRTTESNLQALCDRCNLGKSNVL